VINNHKQDSFLYVWEPTTVNPFISVDLRRKKWIKVVNCITQGKFPLLESLADDLTHRACGFAKQLRRHTKLKYLNTTFTAAGDQVAYVDITTTSAELMRRYCSVRGL
jgi:hypothetical protein